MVNEEMVNGEKSWPVRCVAHGLFTPQQIETLPIAGGAEQQLRVFCNKLLQVGLCGIKSLAGRDDSAARKAVEVRP